MWNDSNAIGDAGVLTIGPGITIRGKTGRVSNSNATGEIMNQGTIIAETAGGLFTLGGQGTFTNAGSVSVLTGATLNIAGSWGSTAGSIAVNNGTLNLGGGVSASALNLPAFTRTGGTVNFTGTLDNFGSTLTLTPVTGDWNLANGIIRNGTIASTGGTLLIQGGVLDGVTVTGGVDLSSINNSTVTVKNGMVLSSTINIGKADGPRTGRCTSGTRAGPASCWGRGPSCSAETRTTTCGMTRTRSATRAS